jgi:transcriptional regulator with XRE-family HTH domain
MDALAVAQHAFVMAEKQVRTRFKEPRGRPHFIRQWRKHRGYTQEQLAEMAGMSPGNLSQIENRKQDYTQSTLEALAEALNCEPADLLVRNPADPEGIWSLWDRAGEAERRQIVAVIEGLLRASSG